MRKFLSVLIAFSATTAVGAETTFDREAHLGKVVVVDFWASWCVPCRRSFPWLNAMHEKYGEHGLVIVAVNLDKEREDAERFLESYPAQFSVIYNPDAKLAAEYEVQVMPTSVVFERNGQEMTRHSGFKVKRQKDYEAAILSALNRSSP